MIEHMTASKLQPSKIRAVWTLYQAGHTVIDISEHWEAMGFSSQKACSWALYQMLRRYGYDLRDTAEARRRAYANEPCRGCGCHKDERTPCCDTCASRHHFRKTSGRFTFISGKSEVCAGCRQPLDQKTYGCRRCISRHWARKNSKSAAASRPGLGGLSAIRAMRGGTDGGTTIEEEAA